MMMKDFLRHGLRHGIRFKENLNLLEKNQYFSDEQIRVYQEKHLKKIIQMAYRSVPYYQKVFKKLNLKPEDIRTKDDLLKLPTINKSIVQENFHDFVNKRFLGFRFRGYTSGTTGTPGVFLRDLKSINFENAAVWRQYSWGGKNLKDRTIVLRGDLVCPATQNEPPYWRYNKFDEQMIFSSYHVSDDVLAQYVEEIKKYKPVSLHAYPSTAFAFAIYCQINKIDIIIKNIFTSSEVLWNYQRQVIEAALQGKVYDWYGNAERTVAVGQCAKGSYHEISDYSLVEYLPMGENQYNIVGTTLHNYVMPLIRYQVDDIIKKMDDQSCSCGCSFPVIDSIQGRDDDIVILKDGKKLGRLDHIFKDVPFIREAQIIQHDYEEIEVKVIPNGDFFNEEESRLIERVKKYMGDQVNICITIVGEIPREARNKFQLVKNMMLRK